MAGMVYLLFVSSDVIAASSSGDEGVLLRSALIPKREIGQPEFLREHPEADGRGIVIAVFDTGVDPAAAGLATTTTGERKILDIYDASGSGDVDTSSECSSNEDGMLPGLSGRSLILPEGVMNPSGRFHLGLKAASDLFPDRALKRLKEYEAGQWNAELSRIRAERESTMAAENREWEDKAPEDRNMTEQDLAAREKLLGALEDEYSKCVEDIYYDCVLWHDGEFWRVLVDCDRDGDLADETILRPFGLAGEYATFDPVSNLNFGVQVFEDGNLLSIVTVSGTHGSHVASIASAHFPDEPERDGIAPGAQIISIRIGDPRSGGSSYGTSERRAIALAAQAGVDIVNASWGGLSVYQDGSDAGCQAYDMLVERYGILAVLSAGNNGPALSTAGSAGGEARRVLGVGAYVSPEMGKVLYSTLKENPEAALQFSSRGPTKDGDWGVDVMAPGAALASYSRESLQKVEMSNGTSMASPSVAGAAAVLMSAARAAGVPDDPARIRAAFMLGACPVPGEAAVTEGAGLINLPQAWEHLQSIAEQPAFGAFYDLKVSLGTFKSNGRGFYLREVNPDPRYRVVVRVDPVWIEAVSPSVQADFEAGLRLRSTVDWIEVPEYLHLANAESAFVAHVTVPQGDKGETGAIDFGEVEAFVAGQESLGSVFRVPFTIVRGGDEATFLDEPLERTVELQPAGIKRWFLNVPAGADHLKVRLKHRADDPISRRYIVHGMTLAQEAGIYAGDDSKHVRLDEGKDASFQLKTFGGQVMELALYQYWSSVGASELEVELSWMGLGLSGQPVVFRPNAGWAQLPFQSLQSRDDVKVDAKITHATYVFLPKKTERIAFDRRGELPGSPQHPQAVRQEQVRQVFEFEFKEAFKGRLIAPQDYDAGDYFGGGLTYVYHESGKLLYLGMDYKKHEIEFPKGKVTVIRHYNQVTGEHLSDPEKWPLVIQRKLKSAESVPVFATLRDRFAGKSTDKLQLTGGAPMNLFLQDRIGKELGEIKPEPDYFTGALKFSDPADKSIGEVDLIYFAGAVFEKVANQEPKAKKADDPRSEAEQLADDLRERTLEFLRKSRGSEDSAVQEESGRLLVRLRKERPEDPEAIFEDALHRAISDGLAGEWWNGREVETVDESACGEIEALLDEALRQIDPEAVAKFFGAPPSAAPGDVEARYALERQKKELEEKRNLIVSIEQLRVDLLLASGSCDQALKALMEIARWEEKPGSQTLRIQLALYRTSGFSGLALKTLNTCLEENPYDEKLLTKRIALYRELGWDRFADAEEARLALWKEGKRRIEVL